MDLATEVVLIRFIHTLISIILIFFLVTTHAADLKKIEHELSDSMITTIITAKYTKSHNLNPLKIHVTTDNGVVNLSGHVKNKEYYMEALSIAKNTKGVKKIETNNLEIKPENATITDAYITTKVEAAVLKAKILDDESIPLVGINAKTNNGVVVLSGQVKYRRSIIFLTKRVSELRGVRRVISKLKVCKEVS